MGRAPRGRALGAARRLLLRRVRAPRVAADLLGRPRHPRGRSHQERVGPRHPARWRRPVLRPGLLQAAAGSRRAGSTRTISTSTAGCCRSNRPRATASRSRCHRHAHGHDCRARLDAVGRPEHAAPARLERRRQPAGGPRADRAPLRWRRSRPHPSRAAARRRRRPRSRWRWASPPASST